MQCEHAATSGATTCTTGTPPRYSLTQRQSGPIGAGGGRPQRAARTLAKVGKGGICPPDCSTQADNANNTFLVNQSSTQSNDTGQNQTNDVQGDCRTSGPGCTVNQTTTVQRQTDIEFADRTNRLDQHHVHRLELYENSADRLRRLARYERTTGDARALRDDEIRP